MFSGTTLIDGVFCEVTFYPTNLGQRLRALRLLKGWSSTELARRMNVAPVCIANWELGYCHPNKTSIEMICNFFGVKPSDILVETDVDRRRVAIREFISAAGFNVEKLARKFGISPSTLTYWINTHHISRTSPHFEKLQMFFGDQLEILFDIKSGF